MFVVEEAVTVRPQESVSTRRPRIASAEGDVGELDVLLPSFCFVIRLRFFGFFSFLECVGTEGFYQVGRIGRPFIMVRIFTSSVETVLEGNLEGQGI